MKTFTGGAALEKKLAEIAEKMQGSVSVGFMSGATYPDGTPVAAVAAWNEYGVPENKVPARPFIRGMIADKSDEWANRIEGAAKYYQYDGNKVLTLMGQTMTEDMQAAIVNFQIPANAPSTIAKKGFNKPLIDTGHMKDSVTFKVDE